MKKILFSIFAVAVVAVSCTKFAEDEPIEFKEASAPAVTAETLADDQIKVTVTAEQGTSFFSYLVAKGAAKEIDAEALLEGKSSLTALTYKVPVEGKEDETKTASAVVNYTEAQSAALTITGLSSNTAYTIYAVASNAQGKVSTVVTATATTTDGTAPELVIKKFEGVQKDSLLVFSIPFDDPVVLGKNPEVGAHFLSRYDGTEYEGYFYFKKQKSVNIPVDSLEVSGNVLYVSIPKEEYIPGAWVSVTYTEGTVENALGAGCAAFEKADAAYAASADKVIYNGICAQYKNVAFKISLNEDGDAVVDDTVGKADEDEEEEAEPEIFSDWKTLVMKSYAQTKYPLAVKLKKTVAISVVDANERTVSYAGKQLSFMDDANGIIGVALDEDPGFGTYVSYTIEEGTIADIYGNTNENFTVEDGYFCSYGYTVDDVIGTYMVASYNAYTAEKSPVYSFAIEASDDAEKGNIVITDYLGIKGKIYATLDFDNGIFSVKAYNIFSGDKTAGYCTYFYKDTAAVFNVPAAGVITSEYYIGAATVADGSVADDAYDSAGNALLLYNFTAQRQ